MNNTIDILSFIKYILKNIHYVVIGIFAGICGALLFNALTVDTIYSSEVKYYLTSSDEVVSYGALQATSTIMDDYLSMIKSKTVVKRAIERNKLDMDEDLIMRMISAANPSKTHLLVVTVKAQDPRQVEDVMEAISYQIVNYIPSIMEGSSLTVFENPETSVEEGNERRILNIIVAVMLGALTAFIVLLVRFISKPTTDDPETIFREFGRINTFLIPKSDRRFLVRKIARQAKVEKDLESNMTELLFGLVFGDNKSRVIMITSPVGTEGKTYVAGRLCQMMQQQGIKVACVGNDLRQFEANESDDNSGQENVSILAMEQKNSLKETIDQLKASNDMIVIDAAPVLQTPEPLILAKYCDKIAVVAKYEHTPIRDLRKAIQRFAYIKCNVHAIVLNQYK